MAHAHFAVFLTEVTDDKTEVGRHLVSNPGTTYILRDGDEISLQSFAGSDAPADIFNKRIGRIEIPGSHGAIKFESYIRGFIVIPPTSFGLPQATWSWHQPALTASTPQHTYTIILRPDDQIRFVQGTFRRNFTLVIEDVQVDSSILRLNGEQNGTSLSSPFHVPPAKPTLQVSRSLYESQRSAPSATPVQSGLQNDKIEETPASDRKKHVTAEPVPKPILSEDALLETHSNASSPHLGNAIAGPLAEPNAEPDQQNKRRKHESFPHPEGSDSTQHRSQSEEEIQTDDESIASEYGAEKIEGKSYSTAPEHNPENHIKHDVSRIDTEDDQGAVSYALSQDSIDLDPNITTEQTLEIPQSEVEVRIPLKRRSTEDERGQESEIPTKRPTKRPRSYASQDSIASNITPDTRPRPTATDSPPSQSTRPKSNISEQPAPKDSRDSIHSVRSSESTSVERYDGKPLRVVFSNSIIPKHPGSEQWLRKQGVKIVEKVSEEGSDILCVGNNALLKTPKFLLSLILGKQIITDTWVTQSRKSGHLLDPKKFLPSGIPSEWEWSDNITSALDRSRRELFKNMTIYCSTPLKKEYGNGFRDVEAILKAAGAKKIISKPALEYRPKDNDIILSSEHDSDGEQLHAKGYQCYNKDLVAMSVVRGSLDLENDEFKIEPTIDGKKTKKAKRKSVA